MTYKKRKIKSPIPFSGKKFSGILLEPIYTKFIPKAKSTGESLYEEIETLRTEIIEKAKTIVWNGPLGNYEIGFFDKTEQLFLLIC